MALREAFIHALTVTLAWPRAVSPSVRRVTLVAVLLTLLAAPGNATVLYDFQSGGALSFSWTQDVFHEDFWVFNDPYDGNPDGPLLTLTEPPGCDVFQIVVDGDGFTGTVPGGNEIEVFGRDGSPLGCFFLFGFGSQRFDHFGTYTSDTATLRISEVPDAGPTWLLGALGFASVAFAARLTRRRLIPDP